MDAKTAEIRYQRWVQVIQDWSNSGLTKRDYCQQNEIDEKQFYYYQRRIRAIIATQGERPALPEGSFTVAASFVGQQSNHPQIVKLRFPGMAEAKVSMIADLPVVVHEHKIPQDQLSCPRCGNEDLEYIGKELVYTEYVQVPAHVDRHDNYVEKYACQENMNDYRYIHG